MCNMSRFRNYLKKIHAKFCELNRQSELHWTLIETAHTMKQQQQQKQQTMLYIRIYFVLIIDEGSRIHCILLFTTIANHRKYMQS